MPFFALLADCLEVMQNIVVNLGYLTEKEYFWCLN